MFVKEAKARIIKNSRKEKSIEVSVKTYKGKFVSSAPSGKSKGIHEVESYNENGIEKSLIILNKICRYIEGRNFKIKKIDDLKDIVELVKKFEAKYGKIGGNCLYPLESVFIKAASKDTNKEPWEFIWDSMNYSGRAKVPMPVGNCIGGGLHSASKKKPDFQEFLLIPDEEKFSRAVTRNLQAYGYAKSLLKMKMKKIGILRTDENAWMSNLTNEETLDVLREVADKYNLRIGLDIASSGFFEKGYYNYKNKKLIRDRVEQIDYIEYLIKKYDIFYVEDPMDEEDFLGFLEITNNLPKFSKTLIVGDDLTTTNIKRVKRAARRNAINAMIVKPNQIGCLLEVKKVVEYCKEKGITMIFSHRSGETMDDFLGDLVMGFQGDFIKSGIYGRERLIKLRRVIEIERSL